MIRATAKNSHDHPRVPPRPPPLGINRLDYEIGLQKGTTSALELSPDRVQLAKKELSPNLVVRMEELTRELGQLRREILFYRQGFENLQRVRESCYDVYQQLYLTLYLDQNFDRLHELTNQLHQTLNRSVRSEAEAKKDWFEFWNVKYDLSEVAGEMI